jgi:N-acetylglutamate synthase-like GNAT family acetyltransferase
MLRCRPFRQQDWEVLLDLANQAVPFAPVENAEWFDYRKSFDDTALVRRHYLALENGLPVGYGSLEQQGDNPHRLRVFVVCSPANLLGGVGDLLYEQLLQDSTELDVSRLWAREFQEDVAAEGFFTSKGFVVTDHFTLPDYRPMVSYALELTD